MPDKQPGAALHVLLVEDSDGDVTMVRRAFSKAAAPCGLHIARDGQEALDYLFRRGEYGDARRPGLVLLDLRLPIIGGVDVLRQVKADPGLSTIPVVVLTALRDEAHLRECMILGTDGYLVKPLDIEDVRYWADLDRGAA